MTYALSLARPLDLRYIADKRGVIVYESGSLYSNKSKKTLWIQSCNHRDLDGQSDAGIITIARINERGDEWQCSISDAGWLSYSFIKIEFTLSRILRIFRGIRSVRRRGRIVFFRFYKHLVKRKNKG